MSNYWKKKMDELEAENKKKSTTSIAPTKTSSTSDYWGNKMAELEEEEKRKKEDIAPVKETKEAEKDTWFKKSDLFDDGWQFGDLFKATKAFTEDLGTHVAQGLIGIGEKVVDGAVLLGSLQNKATMMETANNEIAFNAVQSAVTGKKAEDMQHTLDRYQGVQDDVEAWTGEFVAKDLYDEEAIAKTIISEKNPLSYKNVFGRDVEADSVSGEKLDSVAVSGGELIGRKLTGPYESIVMLTSLMGSEAEEAFNSGATYDEAALSGTITALGEYIPEMLFGGIGINGVDVDGLLGAGASKKLGQWIGSKWLRTVAKLGVDSVGEGLEEPLSDFISALGKKLTYADEKELKELFTLEDAWDSFVGGTLIGGAAGSVNVVKSGINKVDFATGLTNNEKAVVDKVYKDAIAEAEKDGEKLSAAEKKKIHDSVLHQLEKGYISTDTIEEVVGGDYYKTYRDTIDNEDAILKKFEELGNKQNPTLAEQSLYAELSGQVKDIKENPQRDALKEQLRKDVYGLVKGSKLAESYHEGARRRQAFTADLTKYDAKQQEVVKRAIDSGILNNTNKSHEFVDFVAKVSADKSVPFDFANNAKLKESGFAIEGKTVNGFVTKDGVTVNIDSHKALNSVVGHEITHVLEGTELYGELQKALFSYAQSKGDYQGRYDTLKELYKGVEADIDAELTADLVGDYLFTDSDFVNRLSTEHRNVFQKIYDEVKYLLKMATAGSKEARELERVKKLFDEVYRQGGKASEATKYSMSAEGTNTDSDGKALTKEQSEYFKDSKVRDENGNLKVMYHGSQDAGFHVFDPNMSDDDTSLFFVDRNDVAASYSGTSETYEAQSIRTAEDMNNFIERIGAEGYEVVEKDGKFTLLYEGDRVADSNTAKGIYEEFCWYEGVGEGDANYKVYLNLENPLVVDAEGRNWNNISREYSQEIADRYNSLTAEEKAALAQIASWEEISIFRDEINDAVASVENGKIGALDDPYIKNLASAYYKLDGASIYDMFTIASEGFSAESINRFAVKQMNTRDYAAKAKAEGYDGVIFKNIHDNGGYSNGSEGASTVAIAFDSNQIKSVANDKPTGDPDIRYSLSEDSEGRELSQAVKSRFANTKVVDENGSLKVVYHGTATGEFSIFDKSKGSVEGDFGSGFYFSDNDADVSEHYEGGGPDFDNKVARRAEQIEAEEDIDYDEAEKRAREELYKGGHKFEVYLNIENPAIVGETTLFDNESYFEQYNQEDYDSEEDYYGDVEQLVADDIDNIIWDIETKVDVNSTDGIADILWEAFNDGGIDIEALKKKLNNLYLEDSNGNFVANEVARQIIESLGYDGIVDPTVSGKWNMDIEEGTTHYIVFKPNQIKAVTNENPTDNPDIHRSLSFEGEAPIRKGNNVYGEDVRFDAPVTETVDNSVNETTTSVIPEEISPTAEDVKTLFPNEPNLADLQKEEADLDKQIADLHQQFQGETDETAKERILESAKALVEKKNEVSQKIGQMETEQSAWDRERLEGLDDADAPPIQQNHPNGEYMLDETVISGVSENLRQQVGSTVSDSAITPLIRDLYSYMANATDAEKMSGQYEQVVEEKSREIAKKVVEHVAPQKVVNEEAKAILTEIRKPGFYLNDGQKAELRHRYGERWVSKFFGRFKLKSKGKNGIPLDSQWQEWADLYPDLFDADLSDAQMGVELLDIYASLKSGAEYYEPIDEIGMENLLVDELQEQFSQQSPYLNSYPDMSAPVTEEQANQHQREVLDSFVGAPVQDVTPVQDAVQDAPVKEAYEAIKPQKQTETAAEAEPRMMRANSEKKPPHGMEERSWFKTSSESEAVDGMVTPDDIPDDVRFYQIKSNKKTLETANARLARDGYAKSREYFDGRMSERKLSVEDIALGERLIQEAVKAGDAEAVRDLIIDVSILGTELGQRVQALSIIQRLTPEGQLKALIRTVERGKAKGDKAFEGVEVTEDMTKQILDTKNEDGTFDKKKLDDAVEDVKQQIADQMSVSALDYINAWRYLSMLGNPKTHIRNIVSNVAMFGTRSVKNAIARTIEDIAPIKNRTKTWRRATDAVKAFAAKTTTEQEAVIKGDNKYSDEGSIKDKRKIFKTSVANAANNANTSAMEWEDAIFSKNAYRTTLQEYLTANGIKTEADIKNNPEIVAKAKEYALEESRKATFRQDSFFANKISEIERKNPFYGVAVGSVMPFKRTPINIAKTGVAYSPLGFARNIYDAVQVKKGNMDASEAIDHLAQTLTGTSLTLIGFALAEAGLLNGAGDDDKEGKYDYQLGEQSYSFNFGGDTYALSWLSPVAMPLFVGANAYEKLVEKSDWDMNVVVDTLAQTLDPLSEMSFLSSLDDVLSSYDSGIEKFMGAGESMVQNYATQFVPTLSSQIASVFDDTKRSTKASGDSGFEFGETTINKIKYKIPGLRNTLEPTTDIWGNESKQTENALLRGFESFLSPANKREGIATAVDDELKALYGEVGKSEILPAIPDDYINYEGAKYDMSAKDYTEYKQTYGQTAYDLMERLFNTETYKNASSKERADMVADVYDFARDAAKDEYFAKFGVDYTNTTSDGVNVFKENPIKGAIEADLPVDEYRFSTEYPEKYSFFKQNGISYADYKAADEDGKRAYSWAYENPGKYTLSKAVADDFLTFYEYKSAMSDFDAKDANGKTVSGLKKERVTEYINGLDLDYGQKIILYRSMYDSSEDKSAYNYEIIDYLNNREDISYDEMVTILKELGFIVHSDGRVTW